MLALIHPLSALDIIHQSGWVHRDISCGNVYCFKDATGTRGLLGDFEYAKPIADPTEHKQRTVGKFPHNPS